MRWLAFVFVSMFAATAWAQETQAPEVEVQRGPGGKKTYVIKTEFVIEGRIQKPNAFYVLQRSSINYEWASLKQDFLPRITDSVNKAPF
jgi:hypothetical protein